jgi:uncharacterized membrane protein
MMLAAIVFMPFATAYMGMNLGQRVPTVTYDFVMLVTALLNIRLVKVATSAPVVDEHADRVVVARTRARGWGVALGAAVALMLSFFVPAIGQFGLLTIPLWLRLFMTRAERKAAAQA